MIDDEHSVVMGPEKGKSIGGTDPDCDKSPDHVQRESLATTTEIPKAESVTTRPSARKKRRAGRRRLSPNPKQPATQPVAICRNKPQDAVNPIKRATAKPQPPKRPLPTASPRPTNQVKNQNRLDRKRESERKIHRLGRTLEPVAEPKNRQRRESCKDSLEAYCHTYRPNTFYLPFSADHLEVIRDLEAVIKDGGQKAYAMPRGSGKSALLESACEWAVLYGYRRFPFIVTAAESLAVDILDSIRTTFESNETVAEDFPEVCAAIVALDGEPRRCKGQLDDTGKHTGIKWMADSLVLPVVSLAHWKKKQEATGMGATLKVSGITGRIRGTKRKKTDDTYDRPDLALIDDPQSDQSSDSPEQTSKLEKLIHGAVLGLAGPKKKMAALCACTIIKPKDLSARMLDRKRHPEWAGTCHSLVYGWPTNKELWKTYLELRKTDQRSNDKTYKLSNEFYLANRVEMDKGSRVGWEQRFRDGEHSAIQCAYNLLCDVGEEAFMAEYQNQPIEIEAVKIKLTADQVMARCNGYAQGEVPPLSCIVTAFIDVNDFALSFAVGAFTRSMAGAIVLYGEWGMNGLGQVGQTDRPDRIWNEAHPELMSMENGKAPDKDLRFWKALDGLTDYLFTPGLITVEGGNIPIRGILVDNGYNLLKDSTVLFDFCLKRQSKPQPVFLSRGWSSANFPKPSIDVTLEDSSQFGRNDFWSIRRTKYPPNARDEDKLFRIYHDADYHRREMQIAWMLPPGSPGSLTIWGRPGSGPDTDGLKHQAFAKQICSHNLVMYSAPTADRYSGQYTWTKTVGVRDEGSDVTVGCRLAAMVLGFQFRLMAMQTPGQLESPQQTINQTPARPSTVAAPRPGTKISPGWSRTGGF
jgi:hypothetical protein